MNDKTNNSSWLEWSKYILLTLERLDKETDNLFKTVNTLKGKIAELMMKIELLEKELSDELEKKADKSDLKFINYKVAIISSVGTFIVTIVVTVLIKLIFDV